MTKEQKEKALAFLKDMQECTYDGLEEIRTAIEALEQQPSDDCVSRKELYNHCFDATIIGKSGKSITRGILLEDEIDGLPPVTPIRKAPREDITEDEVKINMLELAFNQVKEQAEGIEILTDKYRLIFKAETRSNTVGWSSLENVREKVERGNSDGSN